MVFCNWYWSSGWIEGFKTNNLENAKDIVSQELYMAPNGTDWVSRIMDDIESPIPKEYLWKILEIHSELRVISKFMELCYMGSTGITQLQATKKIVKDTNAYTICNEKILAINKILDNIYKEIQEILDKKKN